MPGNGDDLYGALAERVRVDRRRFLGLVGAGTGVVVLGACSSGGGSAAKRPPSSTLPKTTSGPTTTSAPPVPGSQGITADPFTLGVASGDPRPESVVLWTRLAPEPLTADGTGGLAGSDIKVLWEMASDEAFDKVVVSGIEVATTAFGHSVHAQPHGLEPDTWYHYRFRVGSYVSPVGRARTMPSDDATPDQLRIAFVSCQSRTAGHWTAYDHLAEDDLDLVFHLGDYIYEYPGGEGPTKVALDHEPQTLADYRVLYASYKRDPKLQKAHQRAPWVITWDDHEVQNNYADETPDHAKDQAAFAARRTAAYQAFWEHQPVRIAPPAADGSLDVYRTVRFGRLATFFVLDGRQYRTDQVCGDKVPTSASSCDELDDPDHTMLGTKQEAWLAKGFQAVDTTWTVLAQQTVMKALVFGDVILNVDQWDGYPAARSRLLKSIDAAGLENVVVLTGDIHAAGAADIRLPNADIKGKVVAHELVGTSISSPGVAAVGEAFDLASIGIPYANFVDHGYGRCTITPRRWTAEFVTVDTISEATSPAQVDATLEITAGTAGLRRV
ncbi:MAG: alkaline phosphatase D family protein [Acidimicrobiales bacterium]